MVGRKTLVARVYALLQCEKPRARRVGRSVEDSDEFAIDESVTCLVGKNESGKTAVLQGIYRSNPVESLAPVWSRTPRPARRDRGTPRTRRTPPSGLRPTARHEPAQADHDELQAPDGPGIRLRHCSVVRLDHQCGGHRLEIRPQQEIVSLPAHQPLNDEEPISSADKKGKRNRTMSAIMWDPRRDAGLV